MADHRTTAGPGSRSRPDQCPGVLRPWPAADGALVRIRLVGGRITGRALAGLSALAAGHGDGDVHLTRRANLQLRALPTEPYDAGRLSERLVAAIEELGVLPSRTHDRARNIMVSPQTGLAGGRTDLRPTAAALDAAIRADGRLAALPAKFLITLDDRGDLLGVTADLALVALSGTEAQLRVGGRWSDVVRLEDAVPRLRGLARRFLERRGSGPSAAWHIPELAEPLVPDGRPADGLPQAAGPLPYGDVPGGRHLAAPGGVLSPTRVAELVADLPDPDGDLIVTPWRGVLIPEEM